MTKTLITLSIVILVCVATLVGYGVWYRVVVDRSAQVAIVERQVAEKSQDATRTDALRAILAEIEGDEALVQGYFVSEDRVAAFIDGLEARGRALGAGVVVSSVANADTEGHTALALVLVVSGSFEAVMRTVGAIEYAPYDLTITSLILTHEPKGGWRADLKLTVGSAPRVAPATPK